MKTSAGKRSLDHQPLYWPTSARTTHSSQRTSRLTPSSFPVPMDSPLLNQLFRQLFNHRACQCTRPTSVRRLNGTRHGLQQYQQSRSFLSRRETSSKKNATNDGTMWTKRDDYPRDLDQQLRTFPLVTAKDLRNRRERPRQVKMLTREFIEGMHYIRNFMTFD